MTTDQSDALIDYIPSRDQDREPLGAPIDQVTLLEDRAQVQRIARPTLTSGRHRLFIEDVSPVIQDVSLRARVTQGRAQIADVRIKRAVRTKRSHQSGEIRALEDEIWTHKKRHDVLLEDESRMIARAAKIKRIIGLSAAEIPEDVAWGVDGISEWSESMERLFETYRQIVERLTLLQGELEEVIDAHDLLVKKRHLAARPDQEFVAWLELDVVVEVEQSALTIEIDYVTPNAMWRPLHSARLDGDVLSFTAKAALWQNTGEDWEDVQLIFSTAQSSLGTEPPMLTDDLLTAKRKQEHTTVQIREVDVQSASVEPGQDRSGGLMASPGGVELQGVDDGGDVQKLEAPQRADVPSDGRPHFIDLFDFKALSEVERVLVPEVIARVVLRAVQRNTSKRPVLAGPVELIMQGGPIGWTQTLFVAPGERFELGFGPDEAVRVTRHVAPQDERVDDRDKWRHRDTRVSVFLSNLTQEARSLTLKERVPVSEIKQVGVTILEQESTQGYQVSEEDGFVIWSIDLEPREQRILRLTWRLSMAPDVQTS